MQYPNENQAALLFPGTMRDLETVVRSVLRILEARGAKFNVPEANPHKFYRLFGGDEMMITLEYLEQPANLAVFEQPLGSPVTKFVTPDISQRLATHRSHVLINVSHGVLGGLDAGAEFAELFKDIGIPREGATLPQFLRRLETCALLARIVADHATPSAIHWTQSNQLMSHEAFEALAQLPAPSPLHIHPWLFGGGDSPDGKPMASITTFGARHFIGREIEIEPSVLPWAANYDTILAFLSVATHQNGYVIPDGDTFGPEDGSLSYRVIHRPEVLGKVPVYELEPLLHREYGFQSDGYVPRERAFDDRMPPPDLMPADDEAKMELVNEWREKRALAEGIGGRFEVRSRDGRGPDATPPPNPPSPPPSPLPGPARFGQRPVFGRKIVGG